MTVPSSSSSRCFIDTNIWLYALMAGQDKAKTAQAAALIEREQDIVVSTQVINEVSTNLIKEDLHAGMVFANQTTVVNPFK